jgi:membrane protein implicated in regulation of membrane protease activity
MRGGALPVLAWSGLLAVLFAGNWIWAGDPVQVAQFGFAVLVILSAGGLFALANRDAVRKGPPAPAQGTEVRPLPAISAGAVIAALGLAAATFGLTFGHFAIYFGAGVFVLGIGRVAVERRAERRSAEQLQARRPSSRRDGSTAR